MSTPLKVELSLGSMSPTEDMSLDLSACARVSYLHSPTRICACLAAMAHDWQASKAASTSPQRRRYSRMAGGVCIER
eukprot:scaffold1465_cov383-Prasinococcus_capsulatus_cf.AAC.8